MAALTRSIVILVVAWLACASASSQTPRPERPYRGLFGGNGANPNAVRQLDFTFTVYGGYDDNILANNQSAGGGQQLNDPRFQASGSLGGAQAGLDFRRHTRRSTIDLSAGGAYRYYPSASRFSGLNGWGDGAFSADLTERLTLRAGESVYYSPFYSLASFTGQAPAGVPIGPQTEAFFLDREYALVEHPALVLHSTAALSYRITPRASWSIDYGLRYVDFRDELEPLRDTTAGGTFSYRLNRHATARLGYHYRRGTYGLLASERRPTEAHDIDVGVDYSRSLSVSRKTSFGFTTGSSIYRGFRGAGSVGATDERTRYMLTGTAYLKREMGRSWVAQLDYRRGMHFVEGFGTPFFSDAVSARVGGYAGRRTHLTASAGYTTGAVGIESARGYDTLSANARAQVAAARFLALYADYFYYHYRFDHGVALPLGMTRGIDRNGVRIGITLWAPLLR